MYEDHFSFKYKPFELIPNPDFLFYSSTHKKAMTYLDYGIKEKIGFILLTGEIGSGKTTIIRNLIKHIDGPIKLSRINNTKVSSEQLIAMINEDFGLAVDGKSKTRLLSELNEFLIDQYAREIQPILLIDEAQNLSADLLEEVRLLSNLETDRTKLLQIILVGQPELKKTLMLPELMQLRQRININYHITPLTLEETGQYVKHRLTIAGNPDAIYIDSEVLEHLYRFSRGIPRLINILCDFSLLSAFVDDKKVVTAEVIGDVIKDLESHDYWDETGNRSGAVPVLDKNGIDLAQSVENMAFRLLNLEELLKKNVPDITSISEKLRELEEKLALMSDEREELNRSGRFERLEDKLFSRIYDRILGDSAITDLFQKIEEIISNGNRSGKSVKDGKRASAKQVEQLTNLLNNINSRLRNN